MDYILKTIEKKIKRFEGTSDVKIYYQVKVEYAFYLILAYFWNKNFEELGIIDFIQQGNITTEIQKPSIGSIASIVQKLDIHKELFKPKQNIELSKYAELRNDVIGHGYSFEDNLDSYSLSFGEWYQTLKDLRLEILNRDVDLIIVQNYDEVLNVYTGTLYDSDGEILSNWKCHKEVFDFQIGNLYASFQPNLYFRLSPFIHIEPDDDSLYVYRNVQQPLIGKIRYNRIDKTDHNFTKCWEEFEFSANNGTLKRQANGCIINVFNHNYSRYIEVGSIKNRVYEFLTGKEKGSSVCITLWGHGGNGKTATAQKICEELSLSERKPFEFIIFLSAKDRELNKYTGKITSIAKENRITSFDELIIKLNSLIYNENSSDPTKIIDEKSRLLLVIDDYETFEDSDKEKITKFIKQLNTNYHKVIITTRNSFLKIGDDIQTNELNPNDTIKFLLEVLSIEHGYNQHQINEIQKEINHIPIKTEIHKITLGKPIEIIRFANCLIQKGKVSNSLLREMHRVNSRSERIEFLYGRNYRQLENDKLAQDIFVVIGLLTPIESLTSLTSHIKLILNKKDEEDLQFNSALDKLVKLRLIDIDEDGSYKVDSKDILEIMKQEYEKREHNFKSGTKAIYDRIKGNISADTDRALLNHAKSLRHQANPETAIQQYREILRQGKDFSNDVKLEALFDLADFLFNHRGDKAAAVKLFEEYFDRFYEFSVLKRYSSYTWSINKEKAIRILEDFNSKHSIKGINLNKTQKTHLLSLIVMREGQYWNDKYEQEPSNKPQILDELKRIYRIYGHLLLAQLKASNPTREFTSELINDTTLALENLVNITYRIRNKPVAIEICDFALMRLPDRSNFRFKKKKEKLIGYREKYTHSSPNNQKTVLGEKLKVALNQIEIINLELQNDGYNGTILKLYHEPTKYGYILLNHKDIKGRVYFRDTSLSTLPFNQLKEGDNVKFGFGKINTTKFGAINLVKA